MKKLQILIVAIGCIIGLRGYGQPGWSVNPANYNLDFSVVAVLNIDGNYSADEQDLLAAMDQQGVVRGVAPVTFESSLSTYLVNLTVLGNTIGDTITFKMYQASNDSIYDVINEPLLFQANELVGNPISPYVVSNTNFIVDLDLSNDQVSENAPLQTQVGTFSTQFPNATGTSPVYSFVAGVGDDDNGSFSISGDQLFTNTMFDYAVDSIYTIRVETSESGNALEKAFEIRVVEGAVSVLEKYTPDIMAYPNPSNNFVQIANLPSNTLVELYDMNGRMHYRKGSVNAVITINVANLARGRYQLRVESEHDTYQIPILVQ